MRLEKKEEKAFSLSTDAMMRDRPQSAKKARGEIYHLEFSVSLKKTRDIKIILSKLFLFIAARIRTICALVKAPARTI